MRERERDIFSYDQHVQRQKEREDGREEKKRLTIDGHTIENQTDEDDDESSGQCDVQILISILQFLF